MPAKRQPNGIPGPGVDRLGQAVIDPTQNVLDLVAAAIERQDDLRNKDSEHLKEMMTLRAQYDEKLRNAETARIDAIRAVDQGNVTRASEVAAAQANTLATQLQTSAEALRAQVEATRITTADTLAAALQPIQNDVAVLREVQFRQQGEKAQATEGRDLHSDARTIYVAIASLLVSAGAIIAVIVVHH
jgi:hypothetical protein